VVVGAGGGGRWGCGVGGVVGCACVVVGFFFFNYTFFNRFSASHVSGMKLRSCVVPRRVSRSRRVRNLRIFRVPVSRRTRLALKRFTALSLLNADIFANEIPNRLVFFFAFVNDIPNACVHWVNGRDGNVFVYTYYVLYIFFYRREMNQ